MADSSDPNWLPSGLENWTNEISGPKLTSLTKICILKLYCEDFIFQSKKLVLPLEISENCGLRDRNIFFS